MKPRADGFTLVELLVTMSIIILAITIVLVSTQAPKKNARDRNRVADMKQIEIALEFFRRVNGHYPGHDNEGINKSGEYIGDDDGPIEEALRQYLPLIPRDPLHDTTSSANGYYYSYDPVHPTSAIFGDCINPIASDGPDAVVIAFNRKETNSITVRKDTCVSTDGGVHMNQDKAAYNIALFPSPDTP